jgi:hypothetical protein
MSYLTITYSRKMRCENCDTGCVEPTPILYNKTSQSGSLFSSIVSSKNVYNNHISHIGYETIKGSGNIKKHGSGGNSYNNYLAKKKGLINCNCVVTK